MEMVHPNLCKISPMQETMENKAQERKSERQTQKPSREFSLVIRPWNMVFHILSSCGWVCKCSSWAFGAKLHLHSEAWSELPDLGCSCAHERIICSCVWQGVEWWKRRHHGSAFTINLAWNSMTTSVRNMSVTYTKLVDCWEYSWQAVLQRRNLLE